MICIDNMYTRNEHSNKLTAYAQETHSDYKIVARCLLGRK